MRVTFSPCLHYITRHCQFVWSWQWRLKCQGSSSSFHQLLYRPIRGLLWPALTNQRPEKCSSATHQIYLCCRLGLWEKILHIKITQKKLNFSYQYLFFKAIFTQIIDFLFTQNFSRIFGPGWEWLAGASDTR